MMQTAYLFVLIAAILPYVFTAYAKLSKKGYDNSRPREFLEALEGKGKRAHYAQLNSFEAFPAFGIGVIIAQLGYVSHERITFLAVSFVIFRILYGFFYITDQHLIRSLVWFGGFASMVALYLSAITN
jgi:uncharacterized MAPEG superfamily protein